MINFTETLIILNIKKPNPIMVLLYIERKQKNGSKSCFCFFMITDGKQHKARLFDIITLRIEIVGGAVASWLVRSTPDEAVRIRDLAGDIALYMCSWARHPSNDPKISYHIQIPCWFGYVFII